MSTEEDSSTATSSSGWESSSSESEGGGAAAFTLPADCTHLKHCNINTVSRVLRSTKGKSLLVCRWCETNTRAGRKLRKPYEECTLWMCGCCGAVGCGRNDPGKHALTHANATHPIAINIATGDAWCYACDDDVDEDRYSEHSHFSRVKAVATAARKYRVEAEQAKLKPGKKKHKRAGGAASRQYGGSAGSYNYSSRNAAQSYTSGTLSRYSAGKAGIRGLNNLGNTCFFNSIMQNCTQTRLLRDYFTHATHTIEVDKPSREGSLTSALRVFMARMWEGKEKASVNPSSLFGQIVKKNARFRGYRQQDAHELLRCLLDGVRAEEVARLSGGKRRKSKSVSLAKPNEEESEAQMRLRLTGTCDPATFIDDIFGGVLSSTVICEVCGTHSATREHFLDLSIPLGKSTPPPSYGGGYSSSRRAGGGGGGYYRPASAAQSRGTTRGNTRGGRRAAAAPPNQPCAFDCFKACMGAPKATKSEQNDADKDTTKTNEKESESNNKTNNNNNNNTTSSGEGSEGMDSESEKSAGKGVNGTEKGVNGSGKKGKAPAEASESVDDEDTPRADGESTEAVSSLSDRKPNTRKANNQDESSDSPLISSSTSSELTVSQEEQQECYTSEYDDYSDTDPCAQLLPSSLSEQEEEESSGSVDTDTLTSSSSRAKPQIVVAREKANKKQHSHTADADESESESKHARTKSAGKSEGGGADSESSGADAETTSSSSEERVKKTSKKKDVSSGDEEASGEVRKKVRKRKRKKKEKEASPPRKSAPPSYRYAASGYSGYTRPKPKTLTLEECLDAFVEVERLEKDNQYGCVACTKAAWEKKGKVWVGTSESYSESDDEAGPAEDAKAKKKNKKNKKNKKSKKTPTLNKVDATKRYLIDVPPRALTLHLKRFTQTGYGLRKASAVVRFPLKLDLTPYINPDAEDAREFAREPSANPPLPTATPNESFKYKLYGVSVHSGSMGGGHYTAYVRRRANDGADKWYYFSDTSCSQVSEERVLDAEAYLLFYEREGSVAAPDPVSAGGESDVVVNGGGGGGGRDTEEAS